VHRTRDHGSRRNVIVNERATTRGVDSTLALLRDGYRFISRRCDHYGSDVFTTRLLFEPTICMRGAAAAEVFYDTDRFTRAGAAPDRLVKTLFGEGGVQALDGEAHRVRKQMFLSMMTPDGIDRFVQLADEQWLAAAMQWEGRDRVVLFDEAMQLLTRSVCAWAGVPLPESEVALRVADFAAMIDAAGGVGYRYMRGRIARERGNRWAEGLVDDVRAGRLKVDDDAALARIVAHRDADGSMLDRHEAAVELLNVLRPVVAIARYIMFVAMALHRDHASAVHLRDDPYDVRFVDAFVLEVRRDYPFFPFVAARVRRDFHWRGQRFDEGTRVLLDLHGTNHHAAVWSDPQRFAPERFLEREPTPFDLIPQGGGDHLRNHRCAGEWMTNAVLRHATRFLVSRIRYEVPSQDLTIRLSRVPAVPRSGFVMSHVRLLD
jgi:fatty-acid peroxygenase